MLVACGGLLSCEVFLATNQPVEAVLWAIYSPEDLHFCAVGETDGVCLVLGYFKSEVGMADFKDVRQQ